MPGGRLFSTISAKNGSVIAYSEPPKCVPTLLRLVKRNGISTSTSRKSAAIRATWIRAPRKGGQRFIARRSSQAGTRYGMGVGTGFAGAADIRPRRAVQGSAREAISTALLPPNAKEFDSAWSIRTQVRATFGT